MHTTVTPAPAVWQSRVGDPPAVFAALYRDAAALIRKDGYTPRPEGQDMHQGPHSISSAIDTAAITTRPGQWDAADLAEEACTRLAGFLYALGLLTYRTHIQDMADQVGAWEADPIREYARTTYRYHTADEATAVLETAAAMLGAIPADDAR